MLIPSPKLVGFRKRQLVKNFYKFKLDNRREPLKTLSNASLLGSAGAADLPRPRFVWLCLERG